MNYDSVLSERVVGLKPSGIRRFFDLAATMEGVISLGVGEPDFSTPWSIRKEAIDVLERKKIVYTANAGMADLRKSIAGYLSRTVHTDYDPEHEIVVTVGGSEAIDIAIRAVINPGDEVLVVEPAFVCYDPLVRMACGVPVAIPTKAENHFKLTAQELREKITDKTKLLILPFPNNPTGAIMKREDLEAIAEVLRGTNILVLSDEIYCEMTYGGKHCSIVEIDGMRERTILVNGFSKSYAMTGWRLGYVCAPQPITTADRQDPPVHHHERPDRQPVCGHRRTGGVRGGRQAHDKRIQPPPPLSGRGVQPHRHDLLQSGGRVLCVPVHPVYGHDERGILREAAGGGEGRCRSGQCLR